MGYLKSTGTSFVYVAFFLAVITFSPGLPPAAKFTEYSIKPPVERVGILAPNERLNDAEVLFDGVIKGPESFDSYGGELYTGMHGGHVGKVVGKEIKSVVRFGKACGGIWEEEKCGRPLGLKFDKHGRLYVADAYYGIFKVDVKTGKYERLFDPSKPIDGKIPEIFNSIDVADNGDVYWTSSSTEFKLFNGILASLSDPSGRLIRYNAATKKNEVLLKDLAFANGLKLSDDETYVIVAETISSRIMKYYLKGSKAGKSEVLIDGLPGTPDNIHSDGMGNYFVSLLASADPEHPQISQTLIPHPYLRKMIVRLLWLMKMPFKAVDDLYPNEVSKKAIHAIGSFETIKPILPQIVTVLRINGEGHILDALYNTDEKVAAISSAFVHDNYLWLGSPFNTYLARVPTKQALPGLRFPEKVATPKIEQKVKTSKPTTTTPKPTTTTPKPTTTTPKPKPTTTTPKPTTTTQKPTTTTPKPTTTTPKPTTTTPKPTTTTPKPTTTTPKPTKSVKIEPVPIDDFDSIDELPVEIEIEEAQQPIVSDKLPKQQTTAKTQQRGETAKHNERFADEI